MGQHTPTPTPWVASKPDDFGDMAIMPATGGLAIAVLVNGEMMRMGGKFEEHKANAAFIVEAVNSHATLTARVSELESEVERLRGERDELAENFRGLQRAIVGERGASAVLTVEKMKGALEWASDTYASPDYSHQDWRVEMCGLADDALGRDSYDDRVIVALSPDAKGDASSRPREQWHCRNGFDQQHPDEDRDAFNLRVHGLSEDDVP